MLADVPLDEEVVLVRMDVDGGGHRSAPGTGHRAGLQALSGAARTRRGPTVYRVDGDLIALRKDLASCLCVQTVLAARRSPAEGRKGAGRQAPEPAGVVDAT